jgi:hypothetical protein
MEVVVFLSDTIIFATFCWHNSSHNVVRRRTESVVQVPPVEVEKTENNINDHSQGLFGSVQYLGSR